MSDDGPDGRDEGTGDPVVNEDEVLDAFPEGDNRPLRDQAELEDDTGADIREYTGEPVDTGRGVVIPQQQNQGRDNSVGGGEFPQEGEDADRADAERRD